MSDKLNLSIMTMGQAHLEEIRQVLLMMRADLDGKNYTSSMFRESFSGEDLKSFISKKLDECLSNHLPSVKERLG